jgi:hypothetical protein
MHDAGPFQGLTASIRSSAAKDDIVNPTSEALAVAAEYEVQAMRCFTCSRGRESVPAACESSALAAQRPRTLPVRDRAAPSRCLSSHLLLTAPVQGRECLDTILSRKAWT